MKKIMIKFMGMGLCSKCQAQVSIYDMKGCLIAKGCSNKGEFCFCAKEGNCYKVCYSINGLINCKTIYVNNSWNVYPILYQVVVNNRQLPITFLLTDQSYANLPISKGVMMLWQK